MSFSKRLLSAILSCVMACACTIPSVYAEGDNTDLQYNDTTISTESKVSASVVPKSFFMTNGNMTAQDDPFDVFNIYKAYIEKVTTAPAVIETTAAPTVTTAAPVTEAPAATEAPVTTVPVTTAPKETTAVDVSANLNRESWGIDVSEWQGTIDWKSVKNAGVEFAIIRAGYGRELSQKDPKFDYNVAEAQRAGIDTGVYWYSYAQTVDQAKREAEVCYEIIKKYDFNYPIYYDIEDPSQQYLSTATVSAMAEAFCSVIESKGYYAGIYSSAYFLSGKFYTSVLNKYAVWVAHYGASRPAYNNPYGIWQYSSTGSISGIYGNVDLNHGYFYYPGVIKGQTPPSAPFKAGTYKGIEYSGTASDTDWTAVKNSKVDYAVINAGQSGVVSENFAENYKAVRGAGIKAGAYWTTSAVTTEEILEDAASCYEAIKGLQLEYPVYLKFDESAYQNMTAAEVSVIATQFCAYLQQYRYYVGVYGSIGFLNGKLTQNIFDNYDVLLASYVDEKPNFAQNTKYGIWEYTSDEEIDGISGTVKASGSWRDYGEVMKEYHLNGF